MKSLLLFLLVWFASACACAGDDGKGALVTAAEKPLRLIRGTTVFQAGAGVVLQKGDLLDTGEAMAQVEAGGELVIALAPHTRVYWQELDGKPALALMEGWIKWRGKLAGAGEALRLRSTWLAAGSAPSLVWHVAAGKAELFAEEGSLSVQACEHGSKVDETIKVNQEQYVLHAAGLPLNVAARPASEFLAGMPKSFRDPLAPLLGKLKGKAVEPLRDAEVQYADIADWLKWDMQWQNVALQKEWVKRFRPLLKNPSFHKALVAEFGQNSDWQPVLFPPKFPPKKPKAAVPDGGIIY